MRDFFHPAYPSIKSKYEIGKEAKNLRKSLERYGNFFSPHMDTFSPYMDIS